MTLQEVCNKFNYSQSYVSKNFPRAQAAILKKYHILIQKKGRGNNAIYQIIQDNSRALTLYKEDETRSVMLDTNSIKTMMNIEFVTFLGIIMTPLQVFRGSYKDFLNYIQMDTRIQNIDRLKQALSFLASKDYIHYAIDKTNQDFFFAGIYRKVEEEISVGLTMIKTCKQLGEKYKRSWVALLKMWLGIKYLYIQDLQPYTVKDLSYLTGLSEYQIRKCGQVLEKENTFITDKVYVSYCTCLGKRVMLNGLKEGNQLK